MAKYLRIALFMVCFLSADTVFAATYYIAANGSDSNSGTSKTAPWQHFPGMPNCSNNCKLANPGPGDQIILKGGDTWNFGNTSAANYTGGTINWNIPNYKGSAGNNIYVGVDQTWFTGSAWTRPVFTGDNPLCNLSTLSATCIANTNPSFGQQAYVTACAHSIADPALPAWTNNFFILGNLQFITMDNIEFTGLCTSSTSGSGGSNNYIMLSAASNLLFENLYIHGWSNTQFTMGGTIISMTAWNGGVAATSGVGNEYAFNVVDGSDSDPTALGVCMFCDWYNAHHNVFRFATEGTPTSQHVFHDNLMEDWYAPGDAQAHGNMDEAHTENIVAINAQWNNVYRHISPNGEGQVGIWAYPCAPTAPGGLCGSTTTTHYTFNEAMYDVGIGVGGNYYNIGGSNGQGGDAGPQVIFNNMWQVNFSSNSSLGTIIDNGEVGNVHPISLMNNMYVSDAATPYASTTNQVTFDHDGLATRTNAAAASAGYAISNGYAPTSGSSPTVGVGVNKESICGTLLASGDPLIQAAGTACQSSTTCGVVYDAVNHKPNGPGCSAILRPTSGAWDVGAYQFSGTAAPGPNPPGGLSGKGH